MPELEITATFQYIDDCAIEFYDYAIIRTILYQLLMKLSEHRHIMYPTVKLMAYEYQLDEINRRKNLKPDMRKP